MPPQYRAPRELINPAFRVHRTGIRIKELAERAEFPEYNHLSAALNDDPYGVRSRPLGASSASGTLSVPKTSSVCVSTSAMA